MHSGRSAYFVLNFVNTIEVDERILYIAYNGLLYSHVGNFEADCQKGL